MNFLKILLVNIALLSGGVSVAATADTHYADQQEPEPLLYVVNFTAEWCPNCKVLDPALQRALEAFDTSEIKHIAFDMTDLRRSNETFELVNGTTLAGVYGDYLGVTGLVVMVAADSGEKIECATRIVSSEVIRFSIEESLKRVKATAPGTRKTDSILCPPSNRKVVVPNNE